MTFQPGEIVNITIKGVRVLTEYPDGTVTVRCDDGPSGWAMPPQAAIERVAPASWPPKPGDVWHDGAEDCPLWFAQRIGDDIQMVNASHGFDPMGPHRLLEVARRLTLRHRGEGDQ